MDRVNSNTHAAGQRPELTAVQVTGKPSYIYFLKENSPPLASSRALSSLVYYN